MQKLIGKLPKCFGHCKLRMANSKSVQRFQYFDFETNFQKNENLFQKTGVPLFISKYEDWNCHISMLNCPVRSQCNEWEVQKGPIPKNKVLTVTTLFFFWKLCFSLRVSYKQMIWCTNHPNVHIHTFHKHWCFIEGAFSLWVSSSQQNNVTAKVFHRNSCLKSAIRYIAIFLALP